jgi:hypothetical protein
MGAISAMPGVLPNCPFWYRTREGEDQDRKLLNVSISRQYGLRGGVARREARDKTALVLGLFLMSHYKGQIVLPDGGFYLSRYPYEADTRGAADSRRLASRRANPLPCGRRFC